MWVLKNDPFNRFPILALFKSSMHFFSPFIFAAVFPWDDAVLRPPSQRSPQMPLAEPWQLVFELPLLATIGCSVRCFCSQRKLEHMGWNYCMKRATYSAIQLDNIKWYIYFISFGVINFSMSRQGLNYIYLIKIHDNKWFLYIPGSFAGCLSSFQSSIRETLHDLGRFSRFFAWTWRDVDTCVYEATR